MQARKLLKKPGDKEKKRSLFAGVAQLDVVRFLRDELSRKRTK
jgi:hypothetical protein